MDLTIGASEENQQKNEDKLRLIQKGEMKKIAIEDFPFKEQEQIREFMEMTGDDKEPELFIADFTMEVDDLSLMPLDFLAEMYRDAIVDNEFEEAQKLGEEIIKRNYNIEITEKSVTLRLNG